MGNDYPEAVYSDLKKAERRAKHLNKKQKKDLIPPDSTIKIYWHIHSVEFIKGE
jgi:hypothetical protein